MTLTFNPEKYKEVLAEYQPKPIKTEEENEHALILVEQLMNLSNRSPEQEEIYELLIILIERFEREFYQPNSLKQTKTNPASMLLFLMDQRDLKPIDLVTIFGSIEAAENVIGGRSPIDRATADQLSQLFHVNPNLF